MKIPEESPSNQAAVPVLPVVQRAPINRPSLAKREESVATVPEPSSSFHQPTGVALPDWRRRSVEVSAVAGASRAIARVASRVAGDPPPSPLACGGSRALAAAEAGSAKGTAPAHPKGAPSQAAATRAAISGARSISPTLSSGRKVTIGGSGGLEPLSAWRQQGLNTAE